MPTYKRSDSDVVNTTLYEHDSDCCTYLGQHEIWEGPYDGKYDLYICRSFGNFTVLARYSSNGPDYYSGLCLAKNHPPLYEAAKRAVLLGFLTNQQVEDAINPRHDR